MPPPLIHGPEPLEGGTLLEETEDAVGLVLWQALRDVSLWVTTPQESRGELFAAGAEEKRRASLRGLELADELVAPMDALASLLGDPLGVDEGRLAGACRAVAEWAESRELPGTALAAAQAVALIRDTDARVAYEVGVRARRRAEYARAETWFRRAVMLGRQSGDWTAYSLAFVGLGNLYVQRGNHPIARKLHVRARRAARRHSLHEIEGMALHDLFVIASYSGEHEEAEEYAAAALAAYGPNHPRLPVLAHDVAYDWLEQGYFARALPVFQAALPNLTRAADRVRVLANIARAAAATGELGPYRDAWEEVMERVGRPESAEGAAQALLDLSHGAAYLGEVERAQTAASQASRIAKERNEGRVRIAADAVLDSLRRGRPVKPRPSTRDRNERSEELAHRFVQRLTSMSSRRRWAAEPRT